jgi:hypothetical protein
MTRTVAIDFNLSLRLHVAPSLRMVAVPIRKLQWARPAGTGPIGIDSARRARHSQCQRLGSNNPWIAF